MIKRILPLLLLAITIIIPGCSKYKTVGKVDMKRIVSIEELWAKRAEYEGKVVTVKLGKGSGSAGWTDPIRGKIYNTGNVMVNLNGIETIEQEDAYIKKCCAQKHDDTTNIGTYEFGIVHGAKENKTVEIPKAPVWADEKPGIINIRKNWAEYTDAFNVFWDSEERYLSGLMIGSYCRYVETDSTEIGYHILETRKMVIMPIGYQYLKIIKKP